MNKFLVCGIQNKLANNIDENIEKNLLKIKEARKNGANLAVLPELSNTVYFCQTQNPENFNLAEAIPGISSEIYCRLAKDLKIALVVSLFEKRAAGLYHNTALIINSDGTLTGIYRKMHIPDDPGFYEKYYFTPGDIGFEPVNTSAGRIGVLVCWDQWYPEAARIMALKGAELLVYPTAIGWEPADTIDEKNRQLEAWITIQRGHSIANNIPLISVNRTGFEPAADAYQSKSCDNKTSGIQFWGNSFICGCQGEILAKASADKEENIYAEIDKNQIEKVRRVWPYLRDRRIDFYGELANRYCDK